MSGNWKLSHRSAPITVVGPLGQVIRAWTEFELRPGDYPAFIWREHNGPRAGDVLASNEGRTWARGWDAPAARELLAAVALERES